jgi:hypothetical protein
VLPRRIFRKLVVEPTDGGWLVRAVGFDARFWTKSTSRVFSSRHMALEAARAASRKYGLPLITVESLSSPDGPMAA